MRNVNCIPSQSDFEYYLWKDENGNCFAKIKLTGDTCQVDLKTFQYLRNLELKLRREKKGMPVYGKRNGKSVVVDYLFVMMLSLDENDDDSGISWLMYTCDVEEKILLDIALEEFKKKLTERQLEVLEVCMLGGMSFKEYADEHKVKKASVSDVVRAIRKKAENFFE